jgi:ribonuclease E
MTRKKIGIGLLEAFSEPCEVCVGRGVIVHHEPIMRHKHTNVEAEPKQNNNGGNSNNSGGGKKNKNKNRDQQPQKTVVAVVPAEKASELGDVMAKIAASTVAAHEAAGEPSPIAQAQQEDAASAASLLESVLDALPQPRNAGEGRRKPRRATGGGAQPQVSAENSPN